MTDLNPYTYEQSSVIIEKVEITSFDGTRKFNLAGNYSFINITESMFENTMFGTIGMIDSVGIMEDLPIIGEEIISIKYKTSPSSFIMEKEFRVYSLEAGVLLRESGQMTYLLRFVSLEFFTNEKIRIRRSYKDKKILDIAVDLFSLLGSDQIPVNWFDNDTENSQNLVISNLKPLQAINMCCNLAKSPTGKASLFLFYEGRDGFYFSDVEKLYAQHPETILKKSFIQDELSAGNPSDTLNQILSFQIVKQFDHIASMNKGIYRNKTIGVDPLVKSTKEVTFDYDDDSKAVGGSGLTHVGGQGGAVSVYPIFSDQFKTKEFGEKLDTQQIKLVTSRSNRSNSQYFRANNGDPSFEKTMEEVIPYRLSAYHQLTSYTLQVTVPGNTNLTVGRVVDIDLPSYRIPQDQPGTPHKHKTISGSYLITSIEHKFSGGRFTMDLTLNKDAYPVQQVTTPEVTAK